MQTLRPYSGCEKGLLITQRKEEASMLAAGASDEPRNGGSVEVVVATASASLSQLEHLVDRTDRTDPGSRTAYWLWDMQT